MDKIGRNTDKGKEKAIYPVKARDFTRSYQENLTFNSQRDILKGGMDKAYSSKKQSEKTGEQKINQREKSVERVQRHIEAMWKRTIEANQYFKVELFGKMAMQATKEPRERLMSQFFAGKIDEKQYEDEAMKILQDWTEKHKDYWSNSKENYY